MKIRWESKNNAYPHKLFVSADGENWKEVVDATQAKGGGVNEHKLNEEQVRYVKVDVLGSSAGGWASLWDFEVQGTEMVEVKAATSPAIKGSIYPV